MGQRGPAAGEEDAKDIVSLESTTPPPTQPLNLLQTQQMTCLGGLRQALGGDGLVVTGTYRTIHRVTVWEMTESAVVSRRYGESRVGVSGTRPRTGRITVVGKLVMDK